MSEDQPARTSLSGTAAEKFFIRQHDEYSCGPACLAAIAKIYDVGIDYAHLCKETDYYPYNGTLQTTMDELSRKYMPFDGAGENSYTDGIAIACVFQNGYAHYVVLLCREDDKVLYYDPYAHEFVVDKLDNIHWAWGEGYISQWSVNYMPLPENTFKYWLDMAVPPVPSAPELRPVPPKPEGPYL